MHRVGTVAAGVLGLVLAAAPSAFARAAEPAAGPGAKATIYSAVANDHTRRCLDDSNSSGLRALGCNGTEYQRWYVTTLDNRLKEFKNGKTGRCLDDSVKYRLRTYPCNGYANQKWKWYPIPDGTYDDRTISNAVTNHCLDDSSVYGLRSINCTAVDYQMWFYEAD